ncbi:hypothetical protein Q5Y75_24295 [Ruegeria sp. 2205SS24-7]|uniref:hypothetical protein n=1 Tax=Ruegeria discodermiae TaxID=3064389 RepID=UPI002740A62E|nr:hypothetical protein [Ruegeria sp. 2205SS24-7]MDP5220316.1 hypothetical protein [Ruegeria sp. 2205SS24-7]
MIFQTGAHSTEHERLLKCLQGNADGFAQRGVVIPPPRRYRPHLKTALEMMENAEPAPDIRSRLVETLLSGGEKDRVLLSNTHFFGTQREAFGDDCFYPLAPQRAANLRRMFAEDQMEIFMAIRNPASFLPAAMVNSSKSRISGLMKKLDLAELRWSELFERMHAAVPDVTITVWCNEDSPLIWSQILREMAGLTPDAEVVGGLALLTDILSPEGMSRLCDYLAQHPNMSELHRRRVIAAFMDKYALEEAVEEEIDLPGLTEDLVEEMTEIYDEDVFAIQRIPGVRFIAP